LISAKNRLELCVHVARGDRVDLDSREIRDPQHVVEGKRHEEGSRTPADGSDETPKTSGPGLSPGPEFVIKPHQISAKATDYRLS
jgi:hypothetical protein